MSLFSKLFPKTSIEQATNGYFQTLTAYAPSFTSFSGGIYEADLCRSSIHAFATHCSKLKPEIRGMAAKQLQHTLEVQPNPWQTTSQWLYRTATILEADTTAFIVPILDPFGQNVNGFYTIRASQATLVQDKMGEPWLKFTFPTGKVAAVEYSRVGVMTKFQYDDDFFGSGNKALYPTLNLINTQNQAMIDGVSSSASIRFLAKLAQALKPADIEAEKARFVKQNLTDNATGVAMFDAKYSDVKQITSTPLLIDDKQMTLIKNNVYSYFGTNENILMNSFNEDQWNAYYEGKVEPFAIQLSMVLTNMLYNPRQLAFDNKVMLTSNRLEYASNTTKMTVITGAMDRGVMNRNEAREIFNLPPVDDGDKYYIRTEYSEVDRLTENQGLEKTNDNGGTDDGNQG